MPRLCVIGYIRDIFLFVCEGSISDGGGCFSKSLKQFFCLFFGRRTKHHLSDWDPDWDLMTVKVTDVLPIFLYFLVYEAIVLGSR